MDITRNWRLDTSRSRLIATHAPNGKPKGVIVLPQQNGIAPVETGFYTFGENGNMGTKVEFHEPRNGKER